jgi:CheY-like chemotaxis protein
MTRRAARRVPDGRAEELMSRRILLADDSLTIQKVVELTFADTDYEVVAVSSGDDLLRRLPEVRADIIICDVIMPGRDGYEVCQEIKSNPAFLHLPVILLTGTFEPFDRNRALAAGCSEIVTKPFEARKLVEAVERLLAAPAAAEAAFDEAPYEEGRVTPPPPLMVPEELDAPFSFADLNEPAGEAPPVAPGEPQPSAGEGLDFSTSGFFEMESAGRLKRQQWLDSPPQGLEFELGAEPDGTAGDSADPFLDRGSRAAGFAAEEPAAGRAAAAEDDAFEIGGDDLAGPLTQPLTANAADDEPFADLEPEPTPEPAVTRDVERDRTTPINVAEVMGWPPTRHADARAEAAEPEASSKASDADTQDLALKPRPAAAPAVVPPRDRGLSDDEVERIARKVLELAGDRIDHIAWEVIPDVAEIVVRERVREIEAEAERGRS